jgi:histidinol-phosphate/aromatic aminotransferase/cobyric acid decarboxylase-like protein
MIKADPNAGVYYVCNPNNPSGAITPRKDIEYLLAHKKPYAVVVVDEAYIHFSESAEPCSDLVAADKDIVILRTFSKLYGMAGLRAGMAIGRPDLLEMLSPYGSGSLPITGIAAGVASLRSKNLVKERRTLNKQIRDDTFEHLEKKGVKYIPSEANFFLMEVGRPGAEFARDMAKQKGIIGRTWPIYPTMSRVTVGTKEEMMKFTAAMDKVMGV